MEKSSFAAGCFWGVEHAFKQIKGVLSTKVGYQGGESHQTNYKEVCSGMTGHAEAVLVTFDPNIVSYERLLDAFFVMHDPSQLNRQGPDVGSQYRSALFPMSNEQKDSALRVIEDRRSRGEAIVTTVEESDNFIVAEDNHQDYLEQTPGGYCHIGFDVFTRLKLGEF